MPALLTRKANDATNDREVRARANTAGEPVGSATAEGPAQEQPSPGAAASVPKEKKEDKKEKKLPDTLKKDKGLALLWTVMMKQILRSDQQIGDLWGAMFDTFLLPADSAPVAGMVQQGAGYNEAVQEQGKGHNLGPPYIYTFAGLLDALIQMTELQPLAFHSDLKDFFERYDKLGVKEKCELVRFCKKDKTYKKEVVRVTLCIERTGARAALNQALTHEAVGAELKMGKAPSTYLARDLQEWLDVMGGKKKQQ